MLETAAAVTLLTTAFSAYAAVDDRRTFTFFGQEKSESNSWSRPNRSPQKRLYRWLEVCASSLQMRQRRKGTNFPTKPVEVELTLSPENTEASYKILKSSGIRKMDDAIVELFKPGYSFERPPSETPYTTGLRVRFYYGVAEMYVPRNQPLQIEMINRNSGSDASTCGILTKIQYQKIHEKERQQKTLKYWCEINCRPTEERYKSIFKNDPVSFHVNFDGKSDLGTLRPLNPRSEVANRAAIKILELNPFLYAPRPEVPYESGVIIRFGSQNMTVLPASQE